MLHIVLCLILIFYQGSCFSWFFGNPNNQTLDSFDDIKSIQRLSDFLLGNLYLNKSGTFTMIRSGQISNEAFISCSTIMKTFDYSDFLKNLGNVLFSPEIIKSKIEIIHSENVSNSIKISWMNHDKTGSTCSTIKRLFNKHFPHFSKDMYHFAPHLITQRLLDFQRNVAVTDKSRLFGKRANELQIYNKNNTNFDGVIILICLFKSSLRASFFELYRKEIKGFISKGCNRFGIYSNKDALSKSFVFHQLKAKPKISAKNEAEIVEFFDGQDERNIIIRPPKGIKNIDQFVNQIIQLALNNCN